MNETALTDMTPFLERHDHKSRRLFIAMVVASLFVSTAILAYGTSIIGSARAAFANLWFPIVFYPFFLTAFSIATTYWSRKRPLPPSGHLHMNADDARNTSRVANAGFKFVVGFAVVNIASQTGIALTDMGVMNDLNLRGGWIGRAILVATGSLAMYFGNAWSRIPTPRGPAQKPATQLAYKRLAAWIIVITGLLMVLIALLLPTPEMFYAIGVLSVAALLVWIPYVVLFRNAMKSPTAT